MDKKNTDLNKRVTDLEILIRHHLTVFSMHFSLGRVKTAARRFFIVSVLAAFMLLQGCGRVAGVSSGESRIEQNKSFGESVSVTSSENNTSLSGENTEKGLQREEQTGKENKDMELKSLYLELLGTYLKEQLGLEEYDQEIAGFGCLAVDEDDQSE